MLLSASASAAARAPVRRATSSLCQATNLGEATSFLKASSLFLPWSRPSLCSARAPEALWMMRTPFLLAFLCCPPVPPVQKVCTSKSLGPRLKRSCLGLLCMLVEPTLPIGIIGHRPVAVPAMADTRPRSLSAGQAEVVATQSRRVSTTTPCRHVRPHNDMGCTGVLSHGSSCSCSPHTRASLASSGRRCRSARGSPCSRHTGSLAGADSVARVHRGPPWPKVAKATLAASSSWNPS